MKTGTRAAWVVAGCVGFGGTCSAQIDSFHVMQIQQVIGGVNGDTGKQAIQLRMRTAFQNQVQAARLRAWDAAGANPVMVIDFTTPVANSNGGDTVLVTTSAFDGSTSPACVADFQMTNPIPASYMAAGRLTFEDDFGTIYWSLAWGGAGYTGSNLGALTNSPTGNFGPPFAGPLPTTGVAALAFQGPFTAAAGANATDYALTTGPAVFTNNAGANFTVSGGPPPCYVNCDASTISPILNVNDFSCFLNNYAAGNSYANCDASTIAPLLNVNDFTCFVNKYAAGCP